MTATQEIEGVIDALSKTIAELRETKAKLAKAEDKSKADLEIKKNLALRIGELQKELAEMQVKHVGELEHEKRKGEYLASALYSSFNFGPLPAGQYLVHAPIFQRRPAYFSLQEWRLIVPAMQFDFGIDRQELHYYHDRYPCFCEAAALKVSHHHQERVYKDMLDVVKAHL